ncbi:MAG: DinB family protein [Acidobacteriaceae bacterium]|nr:DinB family protein [Acidobacteriaceae bacterium]
MTLELSRRLAETMDRELPNLRELTEEQASLERAPGKWSPKEELGHLIDSAANNHIRFVRGALEPQVRGPGYAQDEWVRLHGYGAMTWDAILDFWLAYNRFLVRLVERIPDERLASEYSVASNPPVTLEFLIDDYILHMQHHIDQLLRRAIITRYPRV